MELLTIHALIFLHNIQKKKEEKLASFEIKNRDEN